MWVFLKFLICATVLNTCGCFQCDQESTAGDCVCEADFNGGYRVYCPTRVTIRRKDAKNKKLDIKWHPDYKTNRNSLEVSCSEDTTNYDIVEYLKDLAFDKIDKLFVKKCCAMDASFIYDINATSATEMTFSQTRKEKNKSLVSLEGAANLTRLEIVYQDHLILGPDSFKQITKLKRLNLRGNKGIVIHDKSFSKLIDLEEVDISSCRIHQLSEALFTNLRKLKRKNLTST